MRFIRSVYCYDVNSTDTTRKHMIPYGYLESCEYESYYNLGRIIDVTMLKVTEFPFKQMHKCLVIQVKLILLFMLLTYLVFSRYFHLFYYLFIFYYFKYV